MTDKAAATEAVQRAHAHSGRLDVVVNNAGYGQFGTVGEPTEQHVRDQMETNFITVYALDTPSLGLPATSTPAVAAFTQSSHILGYGRITATARR